MRNETRDEYREGLERLIVHVMGHLDEPLPPTVLAEVAGFSTFHFHRIFRGMMGESMAEFVRRVRLERAAAGLIDQHSVTDVAFEAGYDSVEAFSRAFRASFGYLPSAWRRMNGHCALLPTPNGAHFEPQGRVSCLRIQSGATEMNVEIRDIPTMRVVAMRHIGPYFLIGATFGKLAAFAKQNGVPFDKSLAIYHDNPEDMPADQLRSDACLVVPEGYSLESDEVTVFDIPANKYAVATYIGAYDGLGEAWAQFMGKWFPASGQKMGSGVCFELYLDDCSQAPKEQLRTELYEPVAV